jgi:hypothetical protein
LPPPVSFAWQKLPFSENTAGNPLKWLVQAIFRVGRALQHLAIEVQALTVLTLRAVRILQRRQRATESAPCPHKILSLGREDFCHALQMAWQ